MADTKITALTALTGADPANDVIPIVDVSDTTMAASGTTKKISVNNILGASGTATLASATVTGDLTVDTSTLKVDSANDRVGIQSTILNSRLTVRAGTLAGIDIYRDDANANFSGIRFKGTTNSTVNGQIGWSGTQLRIEGTDEILCATNSSDRFRISSSGVFTFENVGGVAGTAMTLNATGLGVGVTPITQARLSLKSSAASPLNLVLQNRDASQNWQFYVDGVVVGDGILTINNGTSSVMQVTPSGNVGIGVTPSAWSAGKALEISSAGNALWSGTGYTTLMQNAVQNSGYKYGTTNPAARYDVAAGTHAWFTAPSGTAGTAITFTQAMTLTATGQLLLGTSSTNGAVDIGMVMNKPSATGFVGNVYQLNGVDKAFAYIASAASAYTTETVSGYIIRAVSATNGVYLPNGGTSWLALSDERFKDIIEPISNAVAKVGSLRSVIGKFKTESEGTRRSFLIAQDVQAVLPEAVDASNPDQLGVAYTEVIPLLVAAIKELTARVQTLETR